MLPEFYIVGPLESMSKEAIEVAQFFDPNHRGISRYYANWGPNNDSGLFTNTSHPYAPMLSYKQWKELKEEFVLPEKWYIVRNAENADVLNKWNNDTYHGGSVHAHRDDEAFFYSDKHYECPRRSISGYKRSISGYTEITFEQFQKYVLKLNNMSNFPKDNFGIRTDGCGTSKKIGEWFIRNGYNRNGLTFSNASTKPATVYYVLEDKRVHCAYESDLPLSVKTIFDGAQMELDGKPLSNKRIIGYKAPTDLWGGSIKKGMIFRKAAAPNDSYTTDQVTMSNNIPKELAETWEPVYEEEKIVIAGYEAKVERLISGNLIAFGCQKINRGNLDFLKTLLSVKEGEFKLTSKGEEITVKTIDSLINMLK